MRITIAILTAIDETHYKMSSSEFGLRRKEYV